MLRTFYFYVSLVCECQRDSDCHGVSKCDGCNCLARKYSLKFVIYMYKDIPVLNSKIIIERDPGYGCEHCPPGVQCDPITGACIKGKLLVQRSEVRLYQLVFVIPSLYYFSVQIFFWRNHLNTYNN